MRTSTRQLAAQAGHGLGATLLVSALSAWFGSSLLVATSVLTTVINASDLGGSSAVQFMLVVVAWIFVVVALYVGAVVTANTFATVMAGRVKTIALLRLLGTTGAVLRRRAALEGLLAGVVGSAIGVALGIGLIAAALPILVAARALPDLPYTVIQLGVFLPAAAVILTTWGAAWVGAQRVTSVSPLAALGSTVEARPERAARHPVKAVLGVLLILGGLIVMGLSVPLGLHTPTALAPAFLGGLATFTGILVGAHLFVRAALWLAGLPLRHGAIGRMSTAHVARHPERSIRSTTGLVIGLTLIVTLAVAAATFADAVPSNGPSVAGGIDAVGVTVGILGAIVGFSTIISSVGLVNNIALGVAQRQREIGLMRALGLTAAQVRRLILLESLQITGAAVGLSMVSGLLFGWVGAQSFLGVVTMHLVPPTVPWVFLAIVIVASVLLALLATAGPTRATARTTPIEALRVA